MFMCALLIYLFQLSSGVFEYDVSYLFLLQHGEGIGISVFLKLLHNLHIFLELFWHWLFIFFSLIVFIKVFLELDYFLCTMAL